MSSSADFESFLKDINPSKATIDEAGRLHMNLRSYLEESKSYSSVFIDAYLSGSYAKHTFIRPKKDSDSCDIDIVIVTNHTTDNSPLIVLNELKTAIEERECYKNVRIQNHSIGIEMTNFHIDVVPLVRDEKGLLFIGSKDNGTWKQTNPKGHISWSTEINQEFDGNFKPLVKIMKWWQRENCPESVKYPKGITLEKMIADNLPDRELPIEERIMQVMTNLSTAYSETIEEHQVPFIEDPAIANNNLASKYQSNDFEAFSQKLDDHLSLLAKEGTGNSTWKKILGNNFPSGNASKNVMTLAKAIDQERALKVKHRRKPSFPFQAQKPNASVTATVTLPSGESYELYNDASAIPKESTVVYRVNCDPVKEGDVKWQVTNTGEEAMRICPRGGFESPNQGKTSRREKTAYTGKHYVQCFVLRKGSCVRWTKPFFINVE